MPTLNIFANFYINDEERFLRLKDSFFSFKDIGATKWVINTRGAYKKEVISFLKQNLGEKLISYYLESEEGWFHDSRKMMNDIDGDFVFFWVEDHINLVSTDKYTEIISEMKESDTDYLNYSWWCFGRPQKIYSQIIKKDYTNIQTFTLDKKNNKQILKNHDHYLISMLGIFSNKLFKKIIFKTSPFLRGHSKHTPFNFEKGAGETWWLPIKTAIPKYELFASIDDEQGCNNYSLQSRGLYPSRIKREIAKPTITPKWKIIFRKKIKKYIPNYFYKKLIKIVIFINRIIKYIYLIKKGM